MKRRLLNLLTAGSLLLCVAAAVAWIRSYTGDEYLIADWANGFLKFQSSSGSFSVMLHRTSHAFQPGGFDYQRAPPSGDRYHGIAALLDAGCASNGLHERWGFVTIVCHGKSYAWDAVIAPYWAMCLGPLLFPLARAIRSTRRNRSAASGSCPACGYDLRATPGRCPECGTAVAAQSRSG